MPDQVLSLDSLIGVELSHYRIIEEIGSGGMGVVFRAHDEHLDREVAIKVLLPGTITDEWARKHLHKEALALSKLNHPNIATIFDFDTQGGIDFLVMEYIPGVTLNEKLAGGPLPENEVLRLGMQLSDGLAAAHEHGVVHRDLKPGNLRLASDGRLKILDFGLAKLRQPLAESAAAETTLQTQAISGTFAYMAPEQLMGEELDARTDIHGAGLVLYEMATGQRPFAEVQSGQLIGAILRRPPAKPRTLNPKLSPEAGTNHREVSGEGSRGPLPVGQGTGGGPEPARPGQAPRTHRRASPYRTSIVLCSRKQESPVLGRRYCGGFLGHSGSSCPSAAATEDRAGPKSYAPSETSGGFAVQRCGQ